MPNEISIILVDDHTIVRNGLRSLIEVMGNYKVVSQYDNGLQFINDIPSQKDPDLAIVDLNMPEMNGLETMRWLHKHKPQLKVLILTLEADDKTIIELFRLGVRGYLSKSCSAETLKKAIESTIYTGYYHTDLLQVAMASEALKKDAAQTVMTSISDRELLFVKLLCDEKEHTYDTIGEMMQVHRRTVDGYRESLFEKFNLRSKTGLVLFAIKHGIVKI